ncbi:MAG: carboxypeptidase-like regulatory domain-containing protein [Muribaculaceae bacterium]|nr:carboxypeptidase-like regulatory domain-containing protein [Muribaculaceae bacterium]
MKRKLIAAIAATVLVLVLSLNNSAKKVYIGDALDRSPLPAASVMNKEGHLLGISENDGWFELDDNQTFPIRVSYLGFREKNVAAPVDSILLEGYVFNLPEVAVGGDKTGVQLICLGTENVVIARGKDSVIMQNKYLLQYILPFGKKPKGFKERSNPKILDSKLKTLTITDGNRVESEQPDFIFPTFIDMERMTAEKFAYPKVLDSLERAAVDIEYNKNITLHYKRRKDVISRYVDAMDGRTEPIKSPGIMSLFGMSFDITRMDYTHRYNYNPSGINAALDLIGFTSAQSIIFKGKLFKKLFKTDEGVKGDIVIEITPINYQLISTEESKQLNKNPGDLKLSDFGY